MSRLRYITCLAFGLLLSFCRAEFPIEDADLTIPRPNQQPEFDPDAPIEDLVLKPFDEQTEQFVVPISGSGPPLGWVGINNSANNHYEEKRLGNDGLFCANVPLAQDQINNVTFVPFDRINREGEDIVITIAQSGTPANLPATPSTDDLDNIALGANGFNHTVSVQDGKLNELFDGNNGTVVVLDNDAIRRDYIEFDLSREAHVLSVAIHAESDCPVEEATIYFTTQSNVPLTRFSWEGTATSLHYEVQNSEWNVFQQIDNPTGVPSLLVPASNPAGYGATRIAIEFTSRDCGWIEGLHRIRDISVFAAPESSPENGPTFQQNLCESGN